MLLVESSQNLFSERMSLPSSVVSLFGVAFLLLLGGIVAGCLLIFLAADFVFASVVNVVVGIGDVASVSPVVQLWLLLLFAA